MNISSIVIQVSPKHIKEVLKIIKEATFCEYHMHDDRGRIIVTLEGKNTEEEIKKLKMIQQIPKVLSADMVYAYSEKELEQEREKMEKEGSMPDWLNDDNIKAEDINYKGNIKGKI